MAFLNNNKNETVNKPQRGCKESDRYRQILYIQMQNIEFP